MTPRVHPNFHCYEIHPDGRVFRVRIPIVGKGNHGRLGEVNGRILKRSGYRQFKLIDVDKKKVFIRANRLVCEVFHGPAPSPEHQAAHNNGMRNDNRYDNLRWDTPLGNTRDKLSHGTMRRGSDIPSSKLKETDIPTIRRRIAAGEHYPTIAYEFGVSISTISLIKRNKIWRVAGAPLAPSRSALERRNTGAAT